MHFVFSCSKNNVVFQKQNCKLISKGGFYKYLKIRIQILKNNDLNFKFVF